MFLFSSIVRYSVLFLLGFRFYSSLAVRKIFSPCLSIARTAAGEHKILIIGDRIAAGFGDLSSTFAGQGGVSEKLQRSIEASDILRQRWHVVNCGHLGASAEDWRPEQGKYFQQYFQPNSSYSDSEFIIILVGHDEISSFSSLSSFESSGRAIAATAIALAQKFPEKNIFLVTPMVPPQEKRWNTEKEMALTAGKDEKDSDDSPLIDDRSGSGDQEIPYERKQTERNSIILKLVNDYRNSFTNPESSNLSILLDSSIYPAYSREISSFSSAAPKSLTSTGYRLLARDLFQCLEMKLSRFEWNQWPKILEQEEKKKKK